jgi:hypothetical protein
MRMLAVALLLVTGTAAADGDFPIYDGESIGPLKAKMTDKQLVDTLGAPAKKATPIQEGATGQWVASWDWKDASALMVSDTGKPPWIARDVSTTHKGWVTKKKIAIGSKRAQVEKAYPRDKDAPPDQDRDHYVVGSPYGGMLITFDHDAVSAISIGVFAF